MTAATDATPTPAPTTLSRVLQTEADLRAIYKRPNRTVIAKDIGRIDRHFHRFIELSPFFCMGTMSADGKADVTPRGGEPGFVHVLDSQRLAIPDRPGNNRIDTLLNLVQRSGIGLVFFVPGFEDTLRVNGTAQITTDEALLQRFVHDGKPPLTVIVVEVREIFLHCGKAVRRSGLWDTAARVDRSALATSGEIYRDQLALEQDAASIDAFLDKGLRETLY
jgi:uncharacterized protein